MNAGGILSPGDTGPGILSIMGNYIQADNGALDMEIGGANPGTGYSQLQVGNLASLNGTLNLGLVDGFIPWNGEEFVILTSAARAEVFLNTTALWMETSPSPCATARRATRTTSSSLPMSLLFQNRRHGS